MPVILSTMLLINPPLFFGVVSSDSNFTTKDSGWFNGPCGCGCPTTPGAGVLASSPPSWKAVTSATCWNPWPCSCGLLNNPGSAPEIRAARAISMSGVRLALNTTNCGRPSNMPVPVMLSCLIAGIWRLNTSRSRKVGVPPALSLSAIFMTSAGRVSLGMSAIWARIDLRDSLRIISSRGDASVCRRGSMVSNNWEMLPAAPGRRPASWPSLVLIVCSQAVTGSLLLSRLGRSMLFDSSPNALASMPLASSVAEIAPADEPEITFIPCSFLPSSSACTIPGKAMPLAPPPLSTR